MASGGRPLPSTPPSPLKEGKELWSITRKLEGRGSEGKEALDSLHDNALVYMRSCFNTAKRRLAEDSSPCKGSPLRPGISAPQNTPTSAAAASGSTSSSTKKQRRSVAEAGQMAQVKQKVALFESFKGQIVGGSSSSSTSTTSTSTSSSSNSSSSSYHAVFPGLNLGDTSTMTTARNFVMTIPRISEEAEDEIVALGESSREEEEGREGGAGRRMVDQGVGTTAARMLDMGNDVQASSSSSSYRQRQEQQQIQRGAGAGGAPSAAGLLLNNTTLTNTQQITLALKELQLTAPSSGPSRQQDKQQEQLEQPKADVQEGNDAAGAAVAAGPAPIIECNHKPSPHGAHIHYQQEDTADSSSSSSSSVGGFLGMVQKTLGLGKHQRGSIPPVHPSSLIGTAAAAGGGGGVMTRSGVLEPLPPIEPEDTYLMSESDEEGRSGGGGGGGGGEEVFSDSEEEEELSRKRRAAKKIPDWARGAALAAALEKQFTTDPALWVDPDTIFPEVAPTCNLEEIFKVRKKRYYKRTSSGIWENDGLTPGEKMTYRRAMKGGRSSIGGGGGMMGKK